MTQSNKSDNLDKHLTDITTNTDNDNIQISTNNNK